MPITVKLNTTSCSVRLYKKNSGDKFPLLSYLESCLKSARFAGKVLKRRSGL